MDNMEQPGAQKETKVAVWTKNILRRLYAKQHQ